MTETADKRTPLRRKLDRFWSTLFLTPEGKPKSALFLYAFCLSLVFFAVYLVLYLVLIDVLNSWLAGGDAWVNQLAQSLIPGLLGTLLCSALWFLPMDKRIVPAAYLWLAAFAIATLIAMAFLLPDAESYRIFLAIFAMAALPGLISGLAVTQVLFRRLMRREAEE